MNALNTRRYEMLVRVREFGVTHADLFPRSSIGGQAFATVADTVANLSQHAAVRLSGVGSARAGVMTKTVARKALRGDVEAIVRTARAIAVTVPGFDAKFRRPRGGDQALIEAARAFLRDAAPVTDRFVEHSMPPDFLAVLERDVAALEAASRDRQSGRDVDLAARGAIAAEMQRGMDAVRILEGTVPNRLRGDTATLDVWQRARRIEYPPRTKPQAAPPAANRQAAAAG